jgi:AT hook motif
LDSELEEDIIETSGVEPDTGSGEDLQAQEVDEDNDFNAALGLKKPVVNKPNISHLAPCYDETGRFTPGVGEKIVMEVNAGRIWLHTRQYRVVYVDEATGNVGLMNDDLGQHAGYNFRTGLNNGFEVRLAPRSGRSIGAKRRGRPPKDPSLKRPEPPVQLDADGNPVKRKRGRPRKNPQPDGAKA